MLRGSVHIPQATTFFRADLWHQVGPLDLSLFFSFDYDLWVRLAKVSQILYVPKRWAKFRIHDAGKTIVNDDRCYPDMLRVLEREGGSWFSWLRLEDDHTKGTVFLAALEVPIATAKMLLTF